MKMLNASTREIDDIEQAVSEILGQLDIDNNLQAQSAGILTCYHEFIESGVVKAVCDALPFDIVGCTTLGNCINEEADTMMLCLSVLTGEDVSFSTANSPALVTDTIQESLYSTYTEAVKKCGDAQPKMAVTFLPMLQTIGGADMIAHLNQVSGGIPLFGTISCDHTVSYQLINTIYNGESNADTASILLISGNISPKFFFASIPEEKIQKQKAIITDSQGNVLKKVNHMPILEYMKTLGLTQGDGIEGASSIPFVIDYNDGTEPSVCAIYLVMDNGYLSCGAPVPVDATLAIGAIDYNDVLSSAQQILDKAMDEPDKHAVLLFPCLSRNLVLEADTMAEMEKIQKIIGPTIPFHMAYSGGEICPVYNTQGDTVNRFHNFTITVCVL